MNVKESERHYGYGGDVYTKFLSMKVMMVWIEQKVHDRTLNLRGFSFTCFVCLEVAKTTREKKWHKFLSRVIQ